MGDILSEVLFKGIWQSFLLWLADFLLLKICAILISRQDMNHQRLRRNGANNPT